jgi:hypothetical protein
VGFMEDCELYGTRELIPISGGCACTSHYDYPRCHERSRALQIFTSFIPLSRQVNRVYAFSSVREKCTQ